MGKKSDFQKQQNLYYLKVNFQFLMAIFIFRNVCSIEINQNFWWSCSVFPKKYYFSKEVSDSYCQNGNYYSSIFIYFTISGENLYYFHSYNSSACVSCIILTKNASELFILIFFHCFHSKLSLARIWGKRISCFIAKVCVIRQR